MLAHPQRSLCTTTTSFILGVHRQVDTSATYRSFMYERASEIAPLLIFRFCHNEDQLLWQVTNKDLKNQAALVNVTVFI